MPKEAPNGKYKVMQHDYGDGSDFINYGQSNQQGRIIALQMRSNGRKEPLIAEFE